MYRVFARASAIVGGSLLLAACASSSSSWLDSLKPAPITENVQFESTPPGAEAKTSTGQTCTTPCSIAMPDSGPFSVTFTLKGYLPESEQVELVSQGDGTSKLRPNPVLVELTAAPPPPRAKKPARKRAAPKRTTAPKPAAAAPAPAPAQPAPPPPAAASPWPTQPQR
jgi:hypothetical protein